LDPSTHPENHPPFSDAGVMGGVGDRWDRVGWSCSCKLGDGRCWRYGDKFIEPNCPGCTPIILVETPHIPFQMPFADGIHMRRLCTGTVCEISGLPTLAHTFTHSLSQLHCQVMCCAAVVKESLTIVLALKTWGWHSHWHPVACWSEYC
jgi:hypothetical protein